jgi:sulfite oxidase
MSESVHEDNFRGIPLSQLFPEERPGWRGYIEWEDKPERKQIAEELLKTKKFTPIPGPRPPPAPPRSRRC